MTENEAKNVLDNVWDFAILSDDESGDILEKAIDIANKALEEIQQYKAIGTVEEIKALKEEVELYRNLDKTNFSDGYAKAIDEFFQELQKYEEDDMWLRLKMSSIYEIAEQLKAGGNNE